MLGQGGRGDAGSARSSVRSFCFEQDANLIYAAFYAAYSISLSTIGFLHWWEFMALFEGLPEDTRIRQIMYYRTADTTGMPKQERKHVERMRNLFRLRGPDREPVSVEELDRRTRERVVRRMAEARRAVEGD